MGGRKCGPTILAVVDVVVTRVRRWAWLRIFGLVTVTRPVDLWRCHPLQVSLLIRHSMTCWKENTHRLHSHHEPEVSNDFGVIESVCPLRR